MAYTSKNPRFNSQTLTDQAGVSVSNPPSGADKLVNRNGQLYLRSSSGTETPIGAGAGGINYLSKISDGTATVGTVSTVVAGGNVSVTGSFPNVTSAWYADTTSGASAIASSTDSSLRGTTNYLTALSGASTSGATFVQTPVFNIDGEDLGKAISIKFDLSGVTTDDDWDVVVVRYDSSGTFQELISVAGNVSTVSSTPSAKLPLSKTSFRGFFITGSTASDTYAVRWRRRNGTDQIRLDTLVVGPEAVMEGAIVTDWESYTPTYTGFGTVTSSEMEWRRNGDQLEVRGNFTTGTTTAVEARLSFPNGYIAKAFSSIRIAGNAIRVGSSATFFGDYLLSEPSVSYFTFGVQAASSNGLTKALGTSFSSSTKETIFASTTIAEWSSNTVMASRAVEEYAATDGTWDANSSSTVYGPAGAAMGGALTTNREKTITFQSPILSTDKMFVEISQDGVVWYDANGFLDTSGNPVINSYSSAGTGSTSSGVFLRKITGSSNQVGVFFFRYAAVANDDSPVINWQSTWYWRVRKVSGGAAVGFPVSARNVIGDTSGTAVPAGYVGEVVSGNSSTPAAFTSATYTDAATISLTKGIWIVSAQLRYDRNGATMAGEYFLGISPNSGNTSTGMVAGESLISADNSNLAVNRGTLTIANLYITLSSDTNYYLKVRADSATGTPLYIYSYRAIRIA